MRRRLPWAAVLQALLTWAVLLGLWLLLVSSVALPEVLAGAIAAAIATAAGIAAVRTTGSRFRPRPIWLWELRRLPWLVLRDSARAGRLLVRTVLGAGEPGRYVALGPLPVAGSGPQEAARRAVYTVAGSLPPGTIVVAVDEETRTLLLHQLIPGPADLGFELR